MQYEVPQIIFQSGWDCVQAWTDSHTVREISRRDIIALCRNHPPSAKCVQWPREVPPPALTLLVSHMALAPEVPVMYRANQQAPRLSGSDPRQPRHNLHFTPGLTLPIGSPVYESLFLPARIETEYSFGRNGREGGRLGLKEEGDEDPFMRQRRGLIMAGQGGRLPSSLPPCHPLLLPDELCLAEPGSEGPRLMRRK